MEGSVMSDRKSKLWVTVYSSKYGQGERQRAG